MISKIYFWKWQHLHYTVGLHFLIHALCNMTLIKFVAIFLSSPSLSSPYCGEQAHLFYQVALLFSPFITANSFTWSWMQRFLTQMTEFIHHFQWLRNTLRITHWLVIWRHFDWILNDLQKILQIKKPGWVNKNTKLKLKCLQEQFV